MKFRCLVCQGDDLEEIFNISPNELDWQEAEVSERQMGSEITHQATWCGECSKGHSLEVVFTTYEYPEGVVSHSSVDPDSDCEAVNTGEKIVYPVSMK